MIRIPVPRDLHLRHYSPLRDQAARYRRWLDQHGFAATAARPARRAAERARTAENAIAAAQVP
jgi:hypothetical protein